MRIAPRLADDVERHVARLRRLESEGEINSGYSDSWYATFEDTLMGLEVAAERHPYAPEREVWGRDVRNALFADYRILYLVVDQQVSDRGEVMTNTKGGVGSSFDDFLRDEGILEETRVTAVKRVLAQAMEEKKLSKSAMARELGTSRSQLDRILDPEYDQVRLDTLTAAARAVGRELRVELVQR